DYATYLSADAVPALIENLPFLNESEQRHIAGRILNRWSQPASGDWRSWNWSRARALSMTLGRAEELRPLGLPPVAQVAESPQEVLSPVSVKTMSVANLPAGKPRGLKQRRKAKKY